MKALKVLLLSSITLLPGCALYDAYMMAGYDTGEYYLATSIRTEAQISIDNCSSSDKVMQSLDKMHWDSLALMNYTQHIPENEEAHSLAINLNKLVEDTQKFYIEKNGQVSGFFCKKKLQIIADNADDIQEVYGSKPR